MKTILYIEDNDQNFYLVSFILGTKGHEVIRARDGREGIDLAVAMRPDLILLDIQLPVMDGYATARELTKCPGPAGTPIVALTSYAMAGDREKALAAGCTGYIEKPINPKTFTEQIEDYLTAGTAGRHD
ncbi:response regulator [Methanoculleus sp. Wushi-C6]|uniref:Response regulator n=1 Tax=Methanoculleus caldifontis TaxID=2651577 RepID=A0ABU3X486_9EURY|nr:response regulator [Methanoculleus sp. Wushi-C6]MDV2482226.1 response regulator [Methanoculleus sp. Wushi-C6]